MHSEEVELARVPSNLLSKLVHDVVDLGAKLYDVSLNSVPPAKGLQERF
jgi:hypothetical protein